MKIKFLLCVILLCNLIHEGHAQQDTIFISPRRTDTPFLYHSIYILPHPSPRTHQRLTDFSFPADLINPGSAKPVPLPPTLPREWISIRKYKGTYYLYAPCDWGNHFQFRIGGSHIITHTMEGWGADRIRSLQVKSKDNYLIRTSSYGRLTLINVRMIDGKKGIALFQFTSGTSRYQMIMVDASRAGLFPVIVHECPMDKHVELEFDPLLTNGN